MKRTERQNHGSRRWNAHCTGSAVNGTYSPSGKIGFLGCSARKKRSTTASHATGIETPISANVVINRSDHLPAVTAEKKPTRIPNSSQMIPAPMQSDKVAGMPRLISWTTFWRFWNDVRMSYSPCFPIRPFPAFCIIFTYWT